VEAADANAARGAGKRREAVRTRPIGDLAPERAGTDPRRARGWVDLDAAEAIGAQQQRPAE
jgi:hypothetical protein